MTRIESSHFFAISSRDPRPADMLLGVAFTDDSMIRGAGGLNDFKRSRGTLFDQVKGGRFTLIEGSSNKTIVRVDPTGQDNLFLYKDGETWIIGNSLLLISEKMKALGIARTPDPAAIAIFRTGNQSLNGGQIISSRTPISNVSLLQANQFATIDYGSSTPLLRIEERQLDNATDYGETLLRFVTTALSRTAALTKDTSAYISLSGGIDSRACLAILTNTITQKERLIVKTNSSYAEAEIAHELTQKCGFRFGGTIDDGRRSLTQNSSMALRLALLGNAGIYAALPPIHNVLENPALKFHGGSIIGSGYMRHTYAQKRKQLVRTFGEDGEVVSEEIGRALQDLSVDPTDPLAMFHHYRAYRSRIHYGRNALTLLASGTYMPLHDDLLVSACLCSDKSYIEGNGVTRDVISLLGPDLLRIKFDSPNKVTSPPIDLPGFDISNVRELNAYGSRLTDDYSGIHSETSEQGDGPIFDLVYNSILANADFFTNLGFSDLYVRDALKELREPRKTSNALSSRILRMLSEHFIKTSQPPRSKKGGTVAPPLKKSAILYGLISLFR